jgi:hypothetical protein
MIFVMPSGSSTGFCNSHPARKKNNSHQTQLHGTPIELEFIQQQVRIDQRALLIIRPMDFFTGLNM